MRQTNKKRDEERWDRDHENAIARGKVFKLTGVSSSAGSGCSFYSTKAAAIKEGEDLRAHEEIKSPNKFEKDPDQEPIFRTLYVEQYRDGEWIEELDARVEYVFGYHDTPEASLRKERARKSELRKKRRR
jgi:hypothetical protein